MEELETVARKLDEERRQLKQENASLVRRTWTTVTNWLLLFKAYIHTLGVKNMLRLIPQYFHPLSILSMTWQVSHFLNTERKVRQQSAFCGTLASKEL